MAASGLEARIAEWRAHVERGRAIDAEDARELESHLRDRIDELRAAGLDDEEAFLVGVRRLGAVDALTREFARVHSGRMWKQLVASGDEKAPRRRNGLVTALLIGFVAAAVIQVIRVTTIGTLAGGFDDAVGRTADPTWLARNAGLVVSAAIAAWLLVRRRPGPSVVLATAIPFLIVALWINLAPFRSAGSGADPQTLLLAAIHAPIACWLLVGVAYLGLAWREPARRMDFVRFTGEGFVYYVLIALGGQVLLALTTAILVPITPGVLTPLLEWGVLSLAVVAFPFAAWLVELKQAVIENIAPVLARVFSPLFAIVTVVAAGVYLALGATRPFDRELMIVFDAVLVVALALTLYNLSARTPGRAARFFDVSALVGIVGSLALDAFVLVDLVARIGEYGWTANRVAAAGLNVILFAVLAGAAVLGVLHLAERRPIAALERWLMATLPAYSIWAAFVVFAIPPIFGFR